MLLYLQQYLIYYRSGCERRQITEPPKIMCSVSCSILSFNSLQWTEIHDVAKFWCGSIIAWKKNDTHVLDSFDLRVSGSTHGERAFGSLWLTFGQINNISVGGCWYSRTLLAVARYSLLQKCVFVEGKEPGTHRALSKPHRNIVYLSVSLMVLMCLIHLT